MAVKTERANQRRPDALAVNKGDCTTWPDTTNTLPIWRSADSVDWTAGGRRGRPTARWGLSGCICIQVDLNTVMMLCCRTYHHYRPHGGSISCWLPSSRTLYSIGSCILPVLPQHISAFFTPALYTYSVPHCRILPTSHIFANCILPTQDAASRLW